MNILFVGRNCKVGGGATFRLRASKGLLGRGHTVSLAARGGALQPRFEAAGVRVYNTLITPFNRLQLLALLKKNCFDVVHVCNPTAGDDVAWVMRRLKQDRPAFVLSVHGVLPPSVKNASGNPSLTESDEILCFDHHARASLETLAGMEKRTVRQLPRPVEKRSEKVSPETPPLLVMVSRLSKSKGKTALAAIEAVEKLQPEFPGLRLHIVGDGSTRGEVQKHCAEVNARVGQELCDAPGSSTDPFPAMTGASCVIGTAYVALEALFHRIPMVASGYEAYGVVTPQNLEEAVSCNFGDSWSGDKNAMKLQTVTTALLMDGFRTVLTHFPTPQGREDLETIGAKLELDHSLDNVAKRLEEVYELAIQKKDQIASSEVPVSR